MISNGLEITRIVGSNLIIRPTEIASVQEAKDTRGAVEHILVSLNHREHPGNKKPVGRLSPNSHIDTPETALQTLEILFQKHEDIFDRRNLKQAEQVGNCLWYLLCEHYGNKGEYSSGINRDPGEQKQLYISKQKLTDAFHYITGNIIDRDFHTSPQYGKISPFDIKLTPETIQSVERSDDFPNIVRILRTFEGVYSYEDENTTKTKKAA